MAILNENGLVLDSIFFGLPEKRILDGVFLKLEPASVCSLFGRNGSGKSTLMKIAAGQITAASGHTVIDAEHFHRRSVGRRFQHLAYLPQDSMMPKDITVRRMISVFPNASHLQDDDLMGPLISSRIDQLSGGEKRYLEVRLVLSLRRKYALLDEPFTGVEPKIIEWIADAILESAKAGTGILLSDHYHQYAVEIADNAYLMQNLQCRHLDGEGSLATQLRDHGYLPRR